MGDWVECYDEGSGLNYYLNSVTGESTWTKPEVHAESSWIEKYDDSSGRSYYYNSVTYETVWDRPADYKSVQAVAIPHSESNPEDIISNWVSGVDPASGKQFYYNNVTQKNQWEVPNCMLSTQDVSSQNSNDAETATIASNASTSKKISMIPMPSRPSLNLGAKSSNISLPLKPNITTPAQSAIISDAPVIISPATEVASSESAHANSSDAFTDSLSIIKDETSQNRASSGYSNIITQRLSESNPPPPPPNAITRDSSNDVSIQLPSISEDNIVTSSVINTPSPTYVGPKTKSISAKQSFDQLRAMEAMVIQEGEDEDNAEDDGKVSAITHDCLKGDLENSMVEESKPKRMLMYSDDKPTEELIEQVTGISFDQYADKFFNFDRKGIFKSRTTVDKLLTWKPDLIKTSLRNLPSDMAQEAVQLFRNVTGYMGDRSSSKTALEHATKILNSMLLSPEELRDEVYCQIVKQTGHNPNTQSAIKGWELMMICLSTFPPSSDMMPHLMAYCVSNLNNELPEIARYSEMCLHRIPKICRLGPRRELPTKTEVEALRRAQQPLVRVYFIDEKYIVVRVDSWTTARDLEESISKLINLQKDSAFSVFEVSTKEEERVLDSEERILDLVAFWQRTTLEEVAKGATDTLEEYRFMFKVGLFYDVEEVDTAGIELMYFQATHDVVDARYPCSEQDAITLAALQMQEECGDYTENCTHLRGKLGNYIAARLIEQKPAIELEESIYKLYEKLKGYSQMEARLSYLDYVKSWKIYGSTYFFAEPQNNKDLPRETILAVNNKAILVVDPATKEFLAEYDYANVVTWGHSANSFVVITGTSNRQNKMYFKTDQGKEINNMVKCYVESRMA